MDRELHQIFLLPDCILLPKWMQQQILPWVEVVATVVVGTVGVQITGVVGVGVAGMGWAIILTLYLLLAITLVLLFFSFNLGSWGFPGHGIVIMGRATGAWL